MLRSGLRCPSSGRIVEKPERRRLPRYTLPWRRREARRLIVGKPSCIDGGLRLVSARVAKNALAAISLGVKAAGGNKQASAR